MKRLNIISKTYDRTKYCVVQNQAYSIKTLLARHQSGLPLPNLQQRYSLHVDENDPTPDVLSENVDLTDVYKLIKYQQDKKMQLLNEQRKKYQNPAKETAVNQEPPAEQNTNKSTS